MSLLCQPLFGCIFDICHWSNDVGGAPLRWETAKNFQVPNLEFMGDGPLFLIKNAAA